MVKHNDQRFARDTHKALHQFRDWLTEMRNPANVSSSLRSSWGRLVGWYGRFGGIYCLLLQGNI